MGDIAARRKMLRVSVWFVIVSVREVRCVGLLQAWVLGCD